MANGPSYCTDKKTTNRGVGDCNEDFSPRFQSQPKWTTAFRHMGKAKPITDFSFWQLLDILNLDGPFTCDHTMLTAQVD